MAVRHLSPRKAVLRQCGRSLRPYLGFALLLFGSGISSPGLAAPNPVKLVNQAAITYTESGTGAQIQQITSVLPVVSAPSAAVVQELPGRITGCAGETLQDYSGFSISLYESSANDLTQAELGTTVPLVETEVPDTVGNDRPLGLVPNARNQNGFTLPNRDGTYAFLLDAARGQLTPGKAYLLLIQPPASSVYDARRIRIVIGERVGDRVSYTATALDGRSLAMPGDNPSLATSLSVQASDGHTMGVLNLSASICQAQDIQIIKTSDRVAAEPGDTLIYRLTIKNLSSSPLQQVRVTDTLPLGFGVLPQSVRAEFNGQSVAVSTEKAGSTVTFSANATLPPGRSSGAQPLNIVYAATTTPDAIRGNGRNSAIVRAQRTDNGATVGDGPATHTVQLRAGILSDCGTLIGRVFVDKNFDGEQQPGEPGIPNAVIYMDDGNRIVTDLNGLFSVSNVISGYRTAVLDLSSIPDYTLAPNLYVAERNSQSRLVRLAPGGMARVNFGVTPALREEKR